MPSHYSAHALAFLSLSSHALGLSFSGETCPSGYERQPTPWIKCGSGANDPTECATIDVPLDYSDPTNDAKTLRIPMVRLPRADKYASEERYAIFYNPGGPGVSGVNAVAGGNSVYDITQQRYDIIGFDPRGIALSNPFTTSPSQSTNYRCDDTGGASPFETDDQLQAAVKAYTTQASKCASNPDGASPGNGPGGWGQYVGTAWVARDIVAMANAINPNKQVRYYGASYGTLLGATLAAMFPAKMDRVVIDGNINPLDYYFGDGSETAAAADLGVSHFFDECAKNQNKNCVLNTGTLTGTQLQAKWDSYLATLYAQSDQTNWYNAKGTMNTKLRVGPSSWVQYAKDLQSAWVAAGVTKRDQISATGISGANAQAAEKAQGDYHPLEAVACGDFQNRAGNPATLDNFRATRDSWKKNSKYMYDQYLSLQYQCDAWQTNAIEQFKYPSTGNNPNSPVLLVNTLYDPVTPLLSANHSRDTFASGKAAVLMSAGAGHCSGAQSITALNTQIQSYLDTGVLPDVSQIYTPVKNAFDEDQETTPSGQTDAGTQKRDFDFPKELMDAPIRSLQFGKRDAVPVGCVPISGTTTTISSSSTSTTSATTTTTSGETTTTTSATTTTTSSETTTTTTTVETTTGETTTTTGETTTTTSTITTTSGTMTSAGITTSVETTASTGITTPSSGTTVTSTSSTTSSHTFSTPFTFTTSSTSGSFTFSPLFTFSTTTESSGTSSTSISTPSFLGVISPTLIFPAGTTSSGTSSTPISTTISTPSFLGVISPTLIFPAGTTSRSTLTTTSSFPFNVSPTLTFSFSTIGPITTSIITSSRPTSGYPVSPITTSTKLPTSSPNGQGSWGTWDPTTKSSAVSTWATWKTITTSPVDPNWAQWTYSTVVSTISKCPTFIPGCKDIVTTKTISYTAAHPTVTVYTTAFANVCPTGLITNTVTITATCNNGCTAKPTGVPSGYTVTKVWCDACAKPTFVDVTTSYVIYKPAGTNNAADPAATWIGWNGNSASSSKKPDAASKTASSSAVTGTWSNWTGSGSATIKTPAAESATGFGGVWNGGATGSTIGSSKTPAAATGTGTAAWNGGNSPSGLIKPYTGTASRQVTGFGSLILMALTAVVLL